MQVVTLAPQTWWWGTILRVVGPACLSALLCALLGSHKREGAKTPPQRCRCSVWWHCKLFRQDFLWPYYLPLRSKAGCCLTRALEWPRKPRCGWTLGHLQSLTLKIFINPPQNAKWMATHVFAVVIPVVNVPPPLFSLLFQRTILLNIICLNFVKGKVAGAPPFTYSCNFLCILFRTQF